MNLSSLSIKRPVATIMILLIIVVLGFSSIVNMPLDLMPDIEYPIAMVFTSYPGASPEEVETMVTETVESALASVEGVDEMMSYSMESASIVMLSFDLDRDMDFATLDMREAVAIIGDYLPEDCEDPTIMKMSMDMMPVMQIYASSETLSLAEITATVNDEILSELERASGVADVTVSGGLAEEVAVTFNQQALSSYGLTISTVSSMLAAENLNLPSGQVEKGSVKLAVRTLGKFQSIEDIKALPITIGDGSIVRLGDIASITQQYQEQDSLTRIDGQTAVGMMISAQSDANTVQVSRAVNKVMKQLRQDHPDMSFTLGYDSADYIKSSLASVGQSAIAGALLAIAVVFLFLRNISTTLIIAVSIPTSLLAAFALMNRLGITLNLVTMCALTITVGMLVDNSIVVLENIYRRRQEIPDSEQAAITGSKEIFLAVVASTLTTIMVFLPIAASDGIAGLMFSDFCWTIVITMLASLLIALTVIPMLCSKIMRRPVETEYLRLGQWHHKYKLLKKFGEYIAALIEKYGNLARWALAHGKKLLIWCLILFIASVGLVFTVGWELLPESDEGMVSVTVELPYGTSLEEQDRIMAEIEAYVMAIPEVEHASMSTAAMSSFSTSGDGSLTLTLTDRTERSRSAIQISDMINDDLSVMTEARVTASASASITDMMGGSDLSLYLMGADHETLETIGYDLENQLSAMNCVEKAELDVSDGNPEVKVVLDRNTAAYYGITAYQLANGLSSALNGSTATELNVNGEDIEVNISLSDDAASSVETMKQIPITGAMGASVEVGQIAAFEYDNAPTYLQRQNQQNYLMFNVNINGDLQDGSRQVLEAMDQYPFPDGYHYEQSGMYDQMMEAFGDLLLALVVAIALVFLLLAAQFESILMSFVVMMAVPFAMTGAFLLLFLTGTALSMTSFLGLIFLVGIVVNNSILLVEFIRQNQETMGIDDALVKAGQMRMRPILMSCATTIVGMIPLSLGLGDGGETLAPMAISIIGGLIASTCTTLLIIPVLYKMIYNRRMRRLVKRDQKDQRIAELSRKWHAEDSINE